MKNNNYKRIGDYIQLVDNRNKDLAITNLLGVSIQKKFIPSIANISGTDMSVYRVIKRNQFAYSPVTSRNGEKLTIALLKEDGDAILSPAYQVFEVINENELIPEYLFMWFNRPEFDRFARFNSWGSAHGRETKLDSARKRFRLLLERSVEEVLANTTTIPQLPTKSIIEQDIRDYMDWKTNFKTKHKTFVQTYN
jgi:hypothetical protein